MGKFKYIAYLCSVEDKKGLEKYVEDIAYVMGRSPKVVASEFIDAYKKAEENKDKPEYREIYKSQKKAVEFYKREHDLIQEAK